MIANDPIKTCLNIENKINDAIKPNPDYDLDINEDTKEITLKIYQGDRTPYLYKSKVYKRHDSASIEVASIELSRLILEGEKQSYDSLQAQDQDLSFYIL